MTLLLYSYVDTALVHVCTYVILVRYCGFSSTTGSIIVKDELDYETQRMYELTVRATDTLTGSYAEIKVQVNLQVRTLVHVLVLASTCTCTCTCILHVHGERARMCSCRMCL